MIHIQMVLRKFIVKGLPIVFFFIANTYCCLQGYLWVC